MERGSQPVRASEHAALGTVAKAIDVLFHLHGAGGACGVSEIARALALPKSTTHRLLASLRRRGLVECDGRGRYRPGVGLVALGLGVLDREPVVAAARPVLEEAAAAIGETVFLTAARAGRIVVLDKAEGTGLLRAAPRVGSEIPVHATAVGKLYLGCAPEQVALPPGRLPAFTPATPTRRADLERAAREARRRGFAENREEWMPGLAVLAAPVRVDGRLVAALAVAAPAARLGPAETAHAIRHIIQSAGRVAARLSGAAV